MLTIQYQIERKPLGRSSPDLVCTIGEIIMYLLDLTYTANMKPKISFIIIRSFLSNTITGEMDGEQNSQNNYPNK